MGTRLPCAASPLLVASLSPSSSPDATFPNGPPRLESAVLLRADVKELACGHGRPPWRERSGATRMLEARLCKLSADTTASLLRASLYRHLRPLKCSPAMPRLLLTSPCGTGTAVHLDEARDPLLPPPMDSSYSYRQAKSQFTDMC